MKYLTIFMIISTIFVISMQASRIEFFIETSDNAVLIKNPKNPIFKENILKLEEEICIGGNSSKEEPILQVRDLAVDDEENIYVLDFLGSNIKVYDNKGSLLNKIGRKGQGPGDLSMPNSLFLNNNKKEIIVQELLSRRISIFSMKGDFKKSISTKEYFILKGQINSSGHMFFMTYLADPIKPVQKLTAFNDKMNLIKEIVSSPAPRPSDPFLPVSYWKIDSFDNIVYAYPKNYEIIIINPEFKIVKKIVKEFDPVGVTKEEIEENKKGLPPTIEYKPSKYHSAFKRFIIEEEGKIIVQTWEKAKQENGYCYDIFSKEGKYIAKIALKIYPLIFKNQKLYSLESDNEGNQVIKRYKIVWLRN